MTKPEAVEEIETEEESTEEPETASTADSAEVSSEKTTGGKMSQTLLEQVGNSSHASMELIVIMELFVI